MSKFPWGKKAHENSARELKSLHRRVERLIRQVYAVKRKHPPEQIWWLTSAFEVYKAQVEVFEMIYLGRQMNEKETTQIGVARAELTRSLTILVDLANALL